MCDTKYWDGATPRQVTRWIKKNILYIKCKNICCYCDKPIGIGKATLEHLTPKCYGGTDDFDNLSIAHAKCNSRRPSEVSWLDWRSIIMNELTPYGFRVLYSNVLTEKTIQSVISRQIALNGGKNSVKNNRNEVMYNF